jgi:hypothetical protein
LVAALTGSTPYHLGALIARRLASKGPIFGEIVASRIIAYLGLHVDPSDEKLTPIKLDIASMKSVRGIFVLSRSYCSFNSPFIPSCLE